jgi:exopolyphosphatase / guanosine-5'-triphosphate,3'-diphosphate pyrophosphatase
VARRQNLSENLAAIDIGSNAIRMVVAARRGREMKILKKFRFPIRLGADVFENGMISAKNLREAGKTFEKFHHLSEELQVTEIKAVGTSALREAKNQKEFLSSIKKRSSIDIEVIDGVEEARLIFLAVKNEVELRNHQALLIDIGGGSVELTFSADSLMTATQSFPFGTVRTLDLMKRKKLAESQINLAIAGFVKPLTSFLNSQSPQKRTEFAVGTGGNLESLGKLKPLLLGKSARSFLSASELSEIISILKKMSIKDRIEKLNLRSDRADVILPAALLVQTVLSVAKIEKIMIPSVGLKEGLLWAMVK